MKIVFAVICFGVLNYSYGSTSAKVILVKGNVTMLEPHKYEAKIVKKGDLLFEDTSIVTGDKSFIKIKFNDNSTMNMGPKSKTIIAKLPENKANMVNLIKGMIKAEVNKHSQKNSETKMLIKTRTAVMGVRGTKFQSTYNPENKNTSLVTVEGRVAMVKREEAVKEMKENHINDSKNPELKNIKTDEVTELDKIFSEPSAKSKVIEVEAGRYAGVVKEAKEITEPVKISPVQYDVLAKSMGSTKKAEEVMKPTENEIKKIKLDAKSSTVNTPKAGGIIDFETGLYIAPAKNAKLDVKTGTFESTKVGKIDKNTGDYIPPKGIKIDPKKGFIIDQKESDKLASNEGQDKLQKQLASLNKNVEKQIVVNKMEAKSDSSGRFTWLPKNHIVSFTLKPYSEVLTVRNKNSGTEADFYTEKANWTILNWNQVWNDKWSSRIRVGGQEYEIDKTDLNVYQHSGDSNEGSFFAIGVVYQYGQKLKILFDMVDRSEFYIVPSNGDGVNLTSRDISLMDIGVQYYLRDWKSFKLWTTATLNLVTSGSAPSQFGEEQADFFGFTVSTDAYYAWKPNMGVESSLWYQRMSAENDSFEFTRNTFGLGFDFVWDI